MGAFIKDGEENNCVSIRNAHTSGAHSNDRCYSTIRNTDELSGRRCENLLELAAKITRHHGKLGAGVDKSSDMYAVYLYVYEVPFCRYRQKRIFGQSERCSATSGGCNA